MAITNRVPAEVLAAARASAASAGDRAAVDVREVCDLADLVVIRRLFDTVWSPGPANPVVTAEILRAYCHTGQYVVLAADRTRPDAPWVAASVGFLAAPAGRTLHSHVTAVLPPGRGRAVGFALKAHQRAWALERGLSEITWTFDPLIRRNAWFNLAKLGAEVVGYFVDFYGAMADAVNVGDATDRLYVRWPLAAAPLERVAAGQPLGPDLVALRSDGALDVLRVDADGGPVAPNAPDASVPAWLAQVPPDVEGLRHTDPAQARAWRETLREVLGGALAAGRRVTGFARDGWYVIEPEEGTRCAETG